MTTKTIYRGREFKFYEKFMSLQKALTDEFFQACPNYQGIVPLREQQIGKLYEGWYGVVLKYDFEEDEKHQVDRDKTGLSSIGDLKKKLATAQSLVAEFGDACPIAGYAVLKPYGVIERHTGIENRDGKYIRVHIPLVVPEGDIGLEADGEEVTWDDLFAFDNQKYHSVWNYTNEPRLVFIIDLDREVCGLPPGTTWDENQAEHFTQYPKSTLAERARRMAAGIIDKPVEM